MSVQENRARDAIFKAVEEAIYANMTVDDFRQEAAACWQQVLNDMKKYAQKDWAKL